MRSSFTQNYLDAKGVDYEQWEAEIDDRAVYLYGLTENEIKIIERKISIF